MKNILCFGDSNTWGYCAESGERFAYEKRWTSLLQKDLGDSYNIIVEGLNGRTTVTEDPFSPCRNGAAALPYALVSHKPLDLVVLMLGTNDTKNFFCNTAFSIGLGIRRLIEMIQASDSGVNGKAPRILLMSPAPVVPGDPTNAGFDIREFSEMGGFNPVKISQELSAEYKRRAKEYGCEFLDAAEHGTVSGVDGVHLSEDAHIKLAAAVAAKIREAGF